jgi:hypothetical protein
MTVVSKHTGDLTVKYLSNDRILRAAVCVLIATLLGMVWGFAGASKLFAGGVPSWFSDQFGKTFLVSFPGLAASFYSLAILESITALAALASFLRGEAFRNVRPTALYIALLGSLALFVQLGFGKQLLFDFAGNHDLYMYFAGTLVMLAMVRTLDPTNTPGVTNTER